MSKFNTLEVNREKGVARVWLNRPDVRNAFNDQMIKELTQIFIDLASDDSCRVIVLGGKGSVFCAGADLNWMKKMATYTQAQNQSDAEKLSEMLDLLYRIPKPTIARVHGHAFAGGMGLVSACDIAVASTKTQFCLSEVKLGLIPATIGPSCLIPWDFEQRDGICSRVRGLAVTKPIASALSMRWLSKRR